MITDFQRVREEQLCRALTQARPDLEAEIQRLSRAWSMGLSAVDALIEQGLLDRDDYEQARRAVPARDGIPWGSFLVGPELGRGASGVVFEARLGGRPAALKVLRSEQSLEAHKVERFRRESEILARLSHPGIVRLLDAGERAGALFLATELIPGGSLQGREPSPVRAALGLILRLAEALQHAHAHGVLHRDLKPGNVLLDAGGAPKLVDFGLAKDEEQSKGLTQTRTILGTLEYSAPEQLGWAKGVGPKCDVYSLGAVLHCLLTGSPPFPAATIQQLLAEARKGPVRLKLTGDDATLSPACDQLLKRVLDVDPRIRPSLGELTVELSRLRS